MLKHMVQPLSAAVRLVASPLLIRAGTAFAAFLIGHGVPSDLTQELVMTMGVLAGLVLDVTVSVTKGLN